MMRKQISFILAVILSTLFLSLPAFAQDESLTITTYYPAPYGVYRNLRLSPSSQGTCDDNQRGTMYYDTTDDKVYVCKGLTQGWQVLGGGIPSGFVGFFNLASCPSGWSELTQARGRTIVGLPLSGTLAGTQGTVLSDLGSRAITGVVSHTHSVNPPSTGTTSGGSHSHATTYDLIGELISGSSARTLLEQYNSANNVVTSSAGSHSHSVDIAAFTSGATGASSVDVSMPYIQLLVCQKD